MYNDLFQMIRSHFGTDEFIPLHEPRFSALDKEFVVDAIDSTFVSSVGAYVDRFEKELADYLGVKHAVVTVNGTSALQVALRMAGVAPDDEVLTQALTFVATANAIVYNNATPVFLDVDRDRMGLSPDAVQAFLQEHTEKRDGAVFNKTSGRRISAIVPMHTFGHPCRIEELCAVADQWGIPVLRMLPRHLVVLLKVSNAGLSGIWAFLALMGTKRLPAAVAVRL